MVAQIVGLKPLKVIYNGADVHLYSNHLDAVGKQLDSYQFNERRGNPQLAMNSRKNLNDFDISDFVLNDYFYNKKIFAPVAV
jgi:thymidylate synthase